MSSAVFRDALGETSDRYDVLLSHLSVIRDLADVAQRTTSMDGLCATLTARIVASLNYERASVLVVREGREPAVRQRQPGRAPRGESSEMPPIPRVLAGDVMAARRLLRWSDEGVGARRPTPPGSTAAWSAGPSCRRRVRIGAILCEEIVSTPWDLARQRARAGGRDRSSGRHLDQVRLDGIHPAAPRGRARDEPLAPQRPRGDLRAQSDRIGSSQARSSRPIRRKEPLSRFDVARAADAAQRDPRLRLHPARRPRRP
jgi:hypothetical protein